MANSDHRENIPVSAENVEQFIQEYSPEVVQGYLLALKDFLDEVEEITFSSRISLNRPAVSQRKLIEAYAEKRHLIKKFEALGVVSPLKKNPSAL